MNGLDHLISRLHAQETQLPLHAQQARDDAAELTLTRAKNNAPVRTGRLRASVTREGGRVFTACPYAPFVELGTVRQAPNPFLSASADMLSYFRLSQQAYREVIR